MPFFRINMEGYGFSFPARNSTDDIQGDENIQNHVVGFFASRVVNATNRSDAVIRATNRIEQEWCRYSKLQHYFGKLTLQVESIDELTFFGYLFAKPRRGFVFYSEE